MSFGAVLVAAVLAHPAGFHERLTLSVSKQAVDGLLVMDIDAGEKAKLIRAGADFDHDGVISGPERTALQKKLVSLAMEKLKLSISGFALKLEAGEVKMSMRDERRVAETGLSVAVLFSGKVSSAIGEGMKLEVSAESPDQSHVVVEVSAVAQADGGVEAVGRRELQAGETWAVRLGRLR